MIKKKYKKKMKDLRKKLMKMYGLTEIELDQCIARYSHIKEKLDEKKKNQVGLMGLVFQIKVYLLLITLKISQDVGLGLMVFFQMMHHPVLATVIRLLTRLRCLII